MGLYCKPPALQRVVLPIFFFNDTATTEIYTLSLHDALPIFPCSCAYASAEAISRSMRMAWLTGNSPCRARRTRSEEHTSELQSRSDLVCRLLLEKKKNSEWTPSPPPCTLRPPPRTGAPPRGR